MKLFLIAPRWPDNSLWGQIYFRFPYLALTTLAGLTDDTWEMRLIDENVEAVPFDEPVDLVGISVMTPLAPRAYTIADTFRRQSVPVVLGGIHPTMMPGEAREHADAVVMGEAERTWQLVLSDRRHGRLKPFYKAGSFQDLERLPLPRRDLLPPGAYFFTKTVQTTRGCPFDCEFCSVTSFYGRTYRTRPVADIVREIEDLGGGHVFFVDDNIVGRPSVARELFAALAPLKIKWFSQASVHIADDRDLLKLAADSGCGGLFIGFESLSQDGLKALGKSVNHVDRYHQAVKVIHDHGIGIQGSFIFGTDQDDRTVFARTLDFVETVHLEAAIFSILTPFPGTRVYTSLRSAGRIFDADWEKYDMNHVVFTPAKMTPAQLQDGFLWAYRKLYGYRSIVKRLFPFKRGPIFFGVQNYGFRQAWKKAIRSYR